MYKKVSWFFFTIMLGSWAYSQTSDAIQIKKLQLKLNKSETIQQAIDASLELGSIYLYREESLKKDMDSANYYFKKAYQFSDSINNPEYINQSIYFLAETQFEQQNFKESYALYHKLIDYYRISNQLLKEAETWVRLGNRTRNEISIDNILYDENITNYNNALKIYKNLGLRIQELSVLKEIADYHLNQGRLNESENELLFIIEEYKKNNLPKIYHSYNLLCVVNRLKGDFNKSLYNGLKGIELMIKSKDTISAPYFYGNVADIYRELGEPEQSVIWYKKALFNWENNKNLENSYIYRCMNYLSRQLILINKENEALVLTSNIAKKKPPSTCFQKACLAGARASYFRIVNEFDSAEKEYLKMLKWMDETPNGTYKILISEANFEVAEFYLERKQHIEAKNFVLKSLNVPEGILAQTKLKDASLMLFKIDSTQGNYIQAISHYQKYKRINDSLFNEAKSRQIEELLIQYETVKKENDIKSLKNENLIQNSKLAKTTILKNYVFAGLILFFIVSLLLYRSYNSKQRTNRLLVSQKGEIAQQNTSLQSLLKEKEWLLKEIHHRVKNNLQIVMSLLNTQSNYIKNPEALSAIKNSQHRLFAISLIHQKLYKTENATLIDMNSYIKDLVGYLKDSFDVNSNIDFKLEIEHIMLEENQSIPVGLILNEAITNAIKYAFPNQEEGLIAVIMKKEENHYFISIKDNGVGIPDSFSWHTSSSLGMALIKGLTKQLDGDFKIKNKEGTLIEIVFVNKIISEIYT